MKLRNILTGAFALATLVTAARADVTIYVTGSTAFRSGALDGIKTKFEAGTGYKYAHDAAAGGVTGSTRSLFQGNFPGISGTTTIACTFTGSVEGIRAVAAPGVANNATYLTAAALPAAAAAIPGTEGAATSTPVAAQPAKFAFTDVRSSSTPVAGTLNPTSPKVGVVVFTPIVNAGSPSNFTSMTSQQFKYLFSNGFVPLHFFTGAAADVKNVYATGRNDGSGTRTTYMAESGLGITTLVNQYLVTAKTGTSLTTVRRVPAGDGTNASTVWSGQDVDGNGGYNSGGTLRTDLARTSASVTVLESDNSLLEGPGADILLASFLSISDARTAATSATPAKIIGWNGVTLSSVSAPLIANAMDATDRAKVTEGQYSAWSFENLYYSGSLSTDENTFYTNLKTSITARLTANPIEGIPLTSMHVDRPDDGAPITTL